MISLTIDRLSERLSLTICLSLPSRQSESTSGDKNVDRELNIPCVSWCLILECSCSTGVAIGVGRTD